MDELILKLIGELPAAGMIMMVLFIFMRYISTPLIGLMKDNAVAQSTALIKLSEVAEKQDARLDKLASDISTEQRKTFQMQEFIAKRLEYNTETVEKSEIEFRKALDDTQHKIVSTSEAAKNTIVADIERVAAETKQELGRGVEQIAVAAHAQTRAVIQTESEEIQESLKRVIQTVVGLSESLVKLTDSNNESRIALDNAIAQSASQSEKRHEVMQIMIRAQADDFNKIATQLMDVQKTGTQSVSEAMGKLLETLVDMNNVVKKAVALPQQTVPPNLNNY